MLDLLLENMLTSILFTAIGDKLRRLIHDYKKIVVLGMPSAGKTRFLCHLNGDEYVEQTTAIDEFKYFSIDTPNGKIYVDDGRDIGGSKGYLSRYKEFVTSADMVFFVFNINDYISDTDYQREVNARLDLIYAFRSETQKCCIIGSHLDVYVKNGQNRSSATAFQNVNSIVYDTKNYTKEFRELFKDNETFFVVDLTKKDSALEIIYRLTK